MTLQPLVRGILPWYVSIGPIYWFIAVSPTVFNLFKYLCAAIVIASPLIFTSHMFYLKPGIIKQSGATLILGIIALSLPAVLIHQSIEGIAIVSKYIILLGLLLGFYWALAYRYIYEKLPIMMSIVMILVCTITIYDWILGGRLWSYDGQMRLYKVGFSTTRTGWSSGLACCAVFLTWQFLTTLSLKRYIYLFAFVCVVFSQLASGGRGGLLASLIFSTLLYVYYGKLHYIIAFIIVGFLFSIANQEMLTSHLRMDRLASSSGGDFSSGRFDHYLLSLEVIRNPIEFLFGLGPHGYKDYFSQQAISNEIHNVWLKLFVEYGFLLPLYILTFISYSIIRFYLKNKNNKNALGAIFVLISGFIPTLVEPNAIISSYQNYLLWWLIFVSIRMNTADQFSRNVT